MRKGSIREGYRYRTRDGATAVVYRIAHLHAGTPYPVRGLYQTEQGHVEAGLWTETGKWAENAASGHDLMVETGPACPEPVYLTAEQVGMLLEAYWPTTELRAALKRSLFPMREEVKA